MLSGERITTRPSSEFIAHQARFYFIKRPTRVQTLKGGSRVYGVTVLFVNMGSGACKSAILAFETNMLYINLLMDEIEVESESGVCA